jgi:hypothetical protein
VLPAEFADVAIFGPQLTRLPHFGSNSSPQLPLKSPIDQIQAISSSRN